MQYIYSDAYPPPQYPQQPYPVQQYQDPNAGLQAPQPYPSQDVNLLPYPTLPPPPAYDIQKGVQPLAEPQAIHVRIYVVMYM